jgi:hypothetical protein
MAKIYLVGKIWHERAASRFIVNLMITVGLLLLIKHKLGHYISP